MIVLSNYFPIWTSDLVSSQLVHKLHVGSAAIFINLATTLVANTHKFTWHMDIGMRWWVGVGCVLTWHCTICIYIGHAVAVHTIHIKLAAKRNPASKRLMRKRGNEVCMVLELRWPWTTSANGQSMQSSHWPHAIETDRVECRPLIPGC